MADADARLFSALLVELQVFESLPVVVPIELKPAQAWFLVGFLQLALRQPGVAGKPKEVIMALARNIEQRIVSGRPAMQEMAARAWAGGDTAATWSAPAGPPPPQPPKAEEPEEEKRKPEVTPQNKQVTPPENKGVGTKRRRLP